MVTWRTGDFLKTKENRRIIALLGIGLLSAIAETPHPYLRRGGPGQS
jgi:hypothetical protein